MIKTNLQRRIDWHPAFDKRDPDPKKNYGIHGMDLRFLVSGKIGTVQFVLYTQWMTSNVRAEDDEMKPVPRFLTAALPADIGYHSRVPQYEGQNPNFDTRLRRKPSKTFVFGEEEITLPDFEVDRDFIPRPCEYLKGDPCFYDGSSLNAKDYFDELTDKGIDALWLKLEQYYNWSLGDESHWISKFYIFKEAHFDDAKAWFYIYRHQNGGWERSQGFDKPYKAAWAKIKTHCIVYYKKANKFIATKLYNLYAMLHSRSNLSR